MASADEITDDERCPPCRGSGEVISLTGGARLAITCPWCGGSGRLPRPAPQSRAA